MSYACRNGRGSGPEGKLSRGICPGEYVQGGMSASKITTHGTGAIVLK